MPQRPQTLVEVRGLAKSFREGTEERTVLAGVDLEVAAGELVALLGRSGSGKSTLIHLMAGIDDPTSGTCHIDGTALQDLTDRERTLFRRDHIGLVFQSFHLIPTLTVLENVLLPRDLAGQADAAARDTARELLARVGLEDRAASFPDVLSGGEQQRTAVARALVTDPKLVLADEPTGNLDEASADVVLDLLSRARSDGRAVVMATHSVAAASRADRIVGLEDGRLLERADPLAS